MTPLGRFRASMAIDYERWREGTSYDLDALAQASGADRAVIEALLVPRAQRDWRDVEALAALGTPSAEAALRAALRSDDARIRMAVTRYAPHLVGDDERLASLLDALRRADFYEGLSEAIDEATRLHPPVVVDALLESVLDRDGGIAVHFAALLLYLYGQADEPFDWAQRPFFLRFNTPDRTDRAAAFRELCARIGADPEPYLRRYRAGDVSA